MKIEQLLYKSNKPIKLSNKGSVCSQSKALVLAFGSKKALEEKWIYNQLVLQYPNANIVTCSTSGEIYDDQVFDDTISVAAIEFEKTSLEYHILNIQKVPDSYQAGMQLVQQCIKKDLSYILVLADGSLVNGSELVRGMQEANTMNVPITGGLAGDAANFNSTLVGLNNDIQNGNIVVVAFYGNSLQIAHASNGGWDMFGHEKTVTKSKHNKLFEIDNKNALDIYKLYLGKYANDLPGSALLFPLSVKINENESVVRTILSIDNEEQSMTFAGDIPMGSTVRFMKANFDKLIDAATLAAKTSFVQLSNLQTNKSALALLISCVGRKLILGNRIDEEIEAVKQTLHPNTMLTGFYSYGEISPLNPSAACALHNQTITITVLNES